MLLLAVNSLLYLNQSIPPYGVSLNSITERSTAFPLSKYLCQICQVKVSNSQLSEKNLKYFQQLWHQILKTGLVLFFTAAVIVVLFYLFLFIVFNESFLTVGPQDGVCISLDCAQATFISYDKLVLSLKGEEM